MIILFRSLYIDICRYGKPWDILCVTDNLIDLGLCPNDPYDNNPRSCNTLQQGLALVESQHSLPASGVLDSQPRTMGDEDKGSTLTETTLPWLGS